MKARPSLDQYLSSIVEELSAELPEVSKKRMFGCDAFFANGNIYALIWDGRVGLKIWNAAQLKTLLSEQGAEPWSPGRSVMSRWALVPESFHDDVDALRLWAHRAHEQAFNAPPKVKKPPKRKTGSKKTSGASGRKR